MSVEATSSSSAYPVKFPTGTILGTLAEEMDKTRKSLERHKQVTVIRPLKASGAELDHLTEQELAALTEVSQAKENQRLWSYGPFICSSVYALTSILYGAQLIANGDEKGWKLVKAGGFLLGNTLMEFTGGWRLVARLFSLGNETWETVLNIVLPIATTYGVSLYSSQVFSQLSEQDHHWIKKFDKYLGWATMITQASQIYPAWIKGRAQLRLTLIEGQIEALKLGINPITQLNESQTATAKSINDRIKNGIKRIFNGTSAIPQGAF